MKIVFGSKKKSSASEDEAPKKKTLSAKFGFKDEEDDDSEASADDGKEPSWLITRHSEQKLAAKRATMFSDNRAPEIWFMDGDEKILRFRHADCIGVLFAYNLKIGKRFVSATKPADNETDLFADEGYKAQFRAIYEVIDKTGYVSKDGKKVKNVARFYVVGHRQHAMIQKIKEKRGDLNKYDIEVSRTGSGKQTSYSYLPSDPEPMPLEFKKIPFLEKEMNKYYAPLDESRQKTLIRQAAAASNV